MGSISEIFLDFIHHLHRKFQKYSSFGYLISVFGLVRFLKIRHFRFRFGSIFDFFSSVNRSSPRSISNKAALLKIVSYISWAFFPWLVNWVPLPSLRIKQHYFIGLLWVVAGLFIIAFDTICCYWFHCGCHCLVCWN